MAYITRELERKFLKLNDFFKVILVTGARQVGKTTMLKHLAESDRTYVTMDNTMARELAQSDPVLFFQTYKPPVLIDEVQKAPELFEQIKIICDESDEKGLIWLTGSQQYNMMKRVRETLAGRIGILELCGLSAREKAGLPQQLGPLLEQGHGLFQGGVPLLQLRDDLLQPGHGRFKIQFLFCSHSQSSCSGPRTSSTWQRRLPSARRRDSVSPAPVCFTEESTRPSPFRAMA